MGSGGLGRARGVAVGGRSGARKAERLRAEPGLRRQGMALAVASLIAWPAFAQQVRPDAGILLEQNRPAPALPAPGGAAATQVPEPRPAAPVVSTARMTPAGFRLQGNTLFTEAQLQPVLAGFVGQPTDMTGLLKAAAAVREFYRERGYLLTQAYLPEQQFAATGGTVVVQVLEARLGKVTVKVEDDGISRPFAEAIVRDHLKGGEPITERLLDRPVLLLRDLAGFDATATVDPGTNVGEADMTVTVKSAGRKVDGSIGADNHGVRSAGQARAWGQVNVNNLTGRGDVFSARAQVSERVGSQLYRLGYTMPVGGWGTRLALTAARTEYELGRQFAALGATGEADILGVSLTHPFVRSRTHNLFGALSYERKELTDRTATPATSAGRDIDSVRASVLGNFIDAALGASFTSYGLHYTHGRLGMDAGSLAFDQGAGGLRTAGSFGKLNLELQRTTFVSAAGRVSASLQGQAASKNLASAEKLVLGGPSGVRGYPSGEGVGDSGAIVQLEYSHSLPEWVPAVPLRASVFYDWGHVRFNENGAPAGGANSETLKSAGLGLAAGTFGRWQVSAQLAWRLDRAAQSDPDKRPRAWLSLQTWL